jgi:Spy/CpxP family protein refolding chaperone
MLSNQPNNMKSNMHYHFSTKTALAMMLASAALYTATVNAAPPYPTPDSPDVASGTMPADPAKPDPAVAQQLANARTKAAQFQGTLLAQNAPRAGASPAASAMPGMGAPAAAASPAAAMAGGMKPGGMGDDKMMGKMDMMMNKMDKMMPMMEKMMGGRMGGGGAMPAAAPAAAMAGGGMEEDDDKMEMAGMMGVNTMGGGAAAAMPGSALPGVPGASHLYHIGVTGFFLDHPEHITLTTEQQAALNKIKDQGLLAKSAADRAIEQAEQELAVLTGADQPDVKKIEAKVRDIAKLSTEQRIAFIKAVGDAAKLLTDNQRKILTGFAPPAPAPPVPAMATPAPAASATPMPMSDM